MLLEQQKPYTEVGLCHVGYHMGETAELLRILVKMKGVQASFQAMRLSASIQVMLCSCSDLLRRKLQPALWQNWIPS